MLVSLLTTSGHHYSHLLPLIESEPSDDSGLPPWALFKEAGFLAAPDLRWGDVDKRLLPRAESWMCDFSVVPLCILFTDASCCCSPSLVQSGALLRRCSNSQGCKDTSCMSTASLYCSSRSSILVTTFLATNFVVNIPGFLSTLDYCINFSSSLLWFKTEWFRIFCDSLRFTK